LLVSALVALSTTGMGAQTVRGRVVDSLTGTPVRDALVMLIGNDGTAHARALSLDGGSYAVAAPAPGRYAIRTKRIGYRPVESALFDVAAGEVRLHDVLAPTVRVTLPSVTVSAQRQCIVRPGDGAPAFQLWEEIRTALYQTALAERGDLFQTIARRWARELDTLARFVHGDSSWMLRGMTQRPFVAVAAEHLERVGFIERKAGNTWYFYAPDGDVLLSESFLRGHCFRLTEGVDGLIGLAFEPAKKKRRIADVKGVLWLDATTAALRHLEFTYTNLPWDVPASRVGGRVEFEQLASGVWIVRRWYVRAPRMGVERGFFRMGGTTYYRSRERFVSIVEHGGEVLETRPFVRVSTR
jgi:hypothetical protein